MRISQREIFYIEIEALDICRWLATVKVSVDFSLSLV